MAYLRTIDDVKLYCAAVPPETVDALELRYPGFVLKQCRATQAKDVDARLRKQYAPGSSDKEEVFEKPYPEAVKIWVGQLIPPFLFRRMGTRPTDEQQVEISKDREIALGELKEAADGEIGLFGLTARANTSDPGRRAMVLSHSEQSPYDWTDVQVEGGYDA